MIFKKANSLKGEITVPGDKSISHRSIMLGSLAKGTTEISNFLQGADCLSTISTFQKMGVDIENKKDFVRIKGNGLYGLKSPREILNVGNSGTTIRLISGILSAQNFSVTLTGDASIQTRPMKRIMTPLTQMGASITSINKNNCAPLTIKGSLLKGIHYNSPVASAQVKSSILFAGLYAAGQTAVTEPFQSRNHTELMLRYFGSDLNINKTTVTVNQATNLWGQKVHVPGDISSAAYFIVAGLIVPNSEILIKNVGINSTRDGIIQVCKKMGGDITLENISEISGEPTADILVRSSNLKGITIEGSLIPTLIDELPIIAVMACFANGKTIIKDAAELKVKESNRIDIMVKSLLAMGAKVIATKDGMIISGEQSLHGAQVDSCFDHRIAMSFAIAGIMAKGETKITNANCVDISYPDFYETLNQLTNS
jgi:3-phosphoshikimate 1-carboxyvinyltransferase